MRPNLFRVLESLALMEGDKVCKQVHYLTESIKSEKGVVKNVHILGLTSTNGRTYEADAVKEAAPLYENADVYLNHNYPDKDGKREDRKVEDKFGFFKNVRATESDGLYGDFHYNVKHPYAEAFEWWLKYEPSKVGFSHDALVEYNQSRTKVISIASVGSVDLVASPATTAGIFEGVIGDKLAADAKARRLSDLTYTAYALLCNVLYGVSETNAGDAERAKAMLPIVRDLASELRTMSNTAAEESAKEEDPMDYTKITLEDLKKNAPKIVAEAIAQHLAAETALDARVAEAVKEVPEALRSKVFLASVRESIDNAEKVKAIVDDRKAISVVKPVEQTPAPVAPVTESKKREEAPKQKTDAELEAEILAALA